MIFRLLKQLETDVWFCFDGFYYGCRCVIDECTKESISLILAPEDRRKSVIFFDHLPKILKHAPRRMHAELRIYFPSKFAKELNSSRKILLMTNSVPKIIKHQLNDVQMQFTNLQGLSTKHAQNWKNIISYEFSSECDSF